MSTLIVANFILMVENILANALVIYILIKTKQASQVIYIMIFILRASDMLIGILAQSSLASIVFWAPCSVDEVFVFVFTFLSHMSNYTIAVLGVDRYFRIKHYATFRAKWTTKLLSKLMCIVFSLALNQAVTRAMGLIFGREHIALSLYILIDSIVICTVIFLQIKTIKTSSVLQNQSTVVVSNRINKKMSKWSLQIMILLCIFTAPQLVVYIVLEIIVDDLNDHKRSIIEFV